MTYPGGSRGTVTRAGERVRNDTATDQDHAIIQIWRAAHRPVLNTFQAILRTRTRGTTAKVAQRLKRKSTIYDKLQREPGMQLARMDDIAGCRIIFRGIRQLHDFRSELHKARFNHKLRHASDPNRYDYLASPKASGYRGIHDVYSYDVNSESGADLKGLYVEIQYRTLIQHAWATASEIVGFVTDSQPKFQRGDPRVSLTMSYASEILARAHEGMFGPHPNMSNAELVQAFSDLDNDLRMMDALRGLNQARSNQSDLKNFILESLPDGTLLTYAFRDATAALKMLFELEKSRPENDIVLVRADSAEEVRLAFRNYFQDARDFVRLIDTGRDKILNKKKSR